MEKTNNESVILLVGAGASVHLGLPTLDDLLKIAVIGNDEIADRIRQTRNSIESIPQRYNTAVFEELIAKIKEYIRMTYLLRTDNTYRTGLCVPHEIDNGIIERKWKSSLVRCYRVLLNEYGPSKIDKKSKAFEVTIDLFREIAKLNNNRLHIFTTNYDCSYQVLGSHTSDIKILSHIDNVDGRFKDNWFCIRQELEQKKLPLIYVHRLHGCVGWFKKCLPNDFSNDSCGIIEEVYGSGDNLSIDDDDFLSNMCIKLIASQLMGANPVFSSSFEEFSTMLESTKIVLVWGYSFRDLEVLRHINDICSKPTKKLKILFLDPYLTESKVLFNIRNTSHLAPIKIAHNLHPNKVEWSPNDGIHNLVKIVTNRILQELKNGKKE